MKTTSCSLGAVLRSDGHRFNPPYFLNAAVDYYNGLAKCPYPITTLGDECEKAFAGNIFSRRFVSEPQHGVPYLTPTEMLKADMSQAKLLSKRQAEKLSYLRVKSGWILISCSGSAALGSVALASARHEQMIGTHDLIRFIPRECRMKSGVLFAFLRSKYGKTTLTHSQYGSCILHIIPEHVKSIKVPVFPETFQREVHAKIVESARLREEADAALKGADSLLLKYAGLRALTVEDYNYFGPRSSSREVSAFSRRMCDVSELSINAFNYSERMQKTIDYVRETCPCVTLREALDDKGLFSTGSFPRLELDSPRSFLLINQTDIFNQKLSGKKIARRGVKAKSLVGYGEVIIAGVGTLGESETFCHVVFANESLVGQLISGEFIRMKTNETLPSGYLYAWLHSEYGFRMIRMTQAGTKLCRPIQRLLLNMPVPILKNGQMQEIDRVVRDAQTKLATAADLENAAIDMVEREIESWQGGGR